MVGFTKETKSRSEMRLKGIPISDGVAIGTLHIVKCEHPDNVPSVDISSKDVDLEIKRYRLALHSSRQDLQKLQSNLAQEGSTEAITIIDTHIQMLDDPFITTEMEERIRKMLKNTETVFQSAVNDYEKQFVKISDTFFKQRLIDVKDLSNRIMMHLNPESSSFYQQIPQNSILFCEELAPSDTAEAPQGHVQGFITEVGGDTSHSALIARAKGIPCVASITIDEIEEADGSMIVIDGSKGLVILHPTKKTLEQYEKRRQQQVSFYEKISLDAHKHAVTKDGQAIAVFANIESINDIIHLDRSACAGIGLLRSEFLFLYKDISEVTEEEQYNFYVKLLASAKDLPITFRVFDIGGDKSFCRHLNDEINPALGCRSIRFLLRYRDIFEKQLRAIFRASKDYDVQLMLPLVTDVDELQESKRFIQSVYDQIKEEYEVKPLKIGSMIEVPSSVIMCDTIAQNCDFLSIGTNDLVQYTLAADRSNPDISDMYKATHPSIIRMLKMIVKHATSANCPLNLCGEMASNPILTALLIGLGLRQLSCIPRYIPVIKHTIRQISLKQAQKLADEVLNFSSEKAIQHYLMDFYCSLGIKP